MKKLITIAAVGLGFYLLATKAKPEQPEITTDQMRKYLVNKFGREGSQVFLQLSSQEITTAYDYVKAVENNQAKVFMSNQQNAYNLEQLQTKYNLFT